MQYYVYLMTNGTHRLYTGITTTSIEGSMSIRTN
jgi:predicted GIY-YIG superfamily endonuclease